MNINYCRMLSPLRMGVMTLAVYGLLASELRAGFTFLGPTPYLSAADSPFAEHLGKPNFYLEDFEDGELNTPGIRQPTQDFPIGTQWQGAVIPPGDQTDSVDGDDGVVDGDGKTGHSFGSGAHLVSQMIPPRNNLIIDFEFDKETLGYLPNAFGFVWTDGPPGIAFGNGFSLALHAMDENGKKAISNEFRSLADQHRDGDTFEDVFIGVISDTSIQAVTINAVFYSDASVPINFEFFEIDHVQYGLLEVPEPNGLLIGIPATALLVYGRFSRFAKNPPRIETG